MAHLPRRRLGSVSDNSAPSSDISDGSESCEIVPDWSCMGDGDSHHKINLQHPNALFINDEVELRHDSISLDNSGIIADFERAQLESFFSGLGTEVSHFLCINILLKTIIVFYYVIARRMTYVIQTLKKIICLH